jgi:hypothetical protein
VFALASWHGEIFPRRHFSRWQAMRDAMRILQQLRTEGGHCLGSNLRPFLLKGNLLTALKLVRYRLADVEAVEAQAEVSR